ncbi:MAG: hypothetical protein Q9162_001964 [Coniocarpon cinnabarinum]
MATDNSPSRESIGNDASSSDSNHKEKNIDSAEGTQIEHPGFVNENPFGSSNREDGKREITGKECSGKLGYDFPEWKKWTILSVIFTVQVSMNFNTSLYSNNLKNIEGKFNVSAQAARCGAMIFLVFYAFGCELWAPWSEEFGRWPILQLSLFLVNIWQILAGLAPNFGSLLVARALGGLSSAGGSVTLGMIADLWDSNHQQYAVAFVVFSSVGGSIFGPIIGGFSERFLGYAWNFWIQLIFGAATQAVHFLFVPETRTTIMMDRIAKKMRKSGQDPHVYGPNELNPFIKRFSFKELMTIWSRPFVMFVQEPIVLFLSLLSGFSDALIFMFLQSFSLIYSDIYGFGIIATNMAFAPILIGYFIAWFSFIPFIRRNIADRKRYPENERVQYESRLWWLLFTAPCLWIGLFGFAWTTLPQAHWIGSMIFQAIIGIANYSIYMATIDYMICAYGPYSASATGGNGFSRDFLAGVLTIPATPFFENIGSKHQVNNALTILACIAILVTIPVYIFYFRGEWFRKRSPFAQSLADAQKDGTGDRIASIADIRRSSVRRASQQSQQASLQNEKTGARDDAQL